MGEIVVLYFGPLTTQNLKSTGVPRYLKGVDYVETGEQVQMNWRQFIAQITASATA